MNKLLSLALLPTVFCLLPLAFDTAPDRITPSLVTLKRRDIRLHDALQELKNQTGYIVLDMRKPFGQPVSNPILSLDLDQHPFWQALDDIAKQAGLSIVHRHAADGGIGLQKRQDDDQPVSYSGPFRIAIKDLLSHRSFADGHRSLEVKLVVAWEPRYQPMLLKLEPQAIMVTREDGKHETAQAGGKGKLALTGLAGELSIRLTLPPRSHSKLRLLAGEFVVLVPPGKLQMAFEKPAQGMTKSEQGVTVKLVRMDTQRQPWTLTVSLQYPAGALDLESHEGGMVNAICYLETEGTRINSTRSIAPQEGGPIHITYYFDPPEKAAKLADYTLIFQAPATPVRYPLRFKFADVPLP